MDGQGCSGSRADPRYTGIGLHTHSKPGAIQQSHFHLLAWPLKGGRKTQSLEETQADTRRTGTETPHRHPECRIERLTLELYSTTKYTSYE